ncbi:MAG TPA: peptidoglycan bridge formation glycyltransferase FemA/FemB family protein [Candidatus Saccharimonadales bacterium]|nr:peptidoglycan bridge formation glycyltransferase FemA/FemB family protein [Candidatus Saccharimonadales bacterium]
MKIAPKPTVRECTAEEYAVALDQLRGSVPPVSFLQAPFYGAWQARDGKTVVYFSATDQKKTIAAGLAVKYDAPGGISFFYCPYGPVAHEWSPELLDAIRQFFAPIARRTGASFVRLDSDGLSGLPGVKTVPNHLAVTASLQPRAEWLLDISPAGAAGQETIWMGMHKHARYNIRLAERAHAQINFYEPAKAPLDTFFALIQTTAGRDSFGIQSKAYYRAVLDSIPPENGFMAVCNIDDQPAAAAIFAAYDDAVHYVFSGSSDNFRKIAPPYFMLWQAILEARKRGWRTFNFSGISDPVKGTHLQGVTAFKKRFGGYEVDHPNPVDLVYRAFKYSLFGLYKKIKG